MKNVTVIALAVNNAVIAASLLVLHSRLAVVEGSVKLLPVLLRQTSSILGRLAESEWYIQSIIAFLTR